MRNAKPTLKSVLTAGEFVVAPGVFEMFSAKLADALDFRALYMTGYGISGSHLGVADAGLATYTDMVSRAGTICEGTRTPLIADADTGFGGLINVRRTVRGYEAAGVQAVQIEDQEIPKKCGHTPNRRVVPLAEMMKRVEVALDARTKADTLIVARTDARASLGLDEAIARGRAFADAGAEIVFVESPESEAEFACIGEALGARTRLLANMVPTGRSPVVPVARLREMGYAIAIYPTIGMTTACAALRAAYRHLEARGDTHDMPVDALAMQELHELVGFADVWAFERRWAETHEPSRREGDQHT